MNTSRPKGNRFLTVVAVAVLASGALLAQVAWADDPEPSAVLKLLDGAQSSANIYVKPSQSVIIKMRVEDISVMEGASNVGVKACQAILGYSSTYLTAGAGCVAPGGGAWDEVIYQTWYIDEGTAGNIDTAIGVYGQTDPQPDPPYDPSACTSENGTVAIITLTATSTEGSTPFSFRDNVDCNTTGIECTFLAGCNQNFSKVMPAKHNATIYIDGTAPTISNCPSDFSVSNDTGNCSAVVTWTAPTASDDNSGIASFTSTHNPGDTFPVGATTVTYTATDNAGNVSTCSFDVTVEDDEDPVITGCPSNISVAVDEDTCGAVVSWTAPTASDNCAVTSFTSDYEPGATFPVGTTTVTYTAKDAADNEATCSFTVTVADDEDPVITDCPSNISVAVDEGTCGAVVSWTAPTASDNCALTSFTSDYEPGATFPVGTTTVTYTAKDAADNEATCSFTVTVADDEDPVITDCPSNISVAVDEGTCGAVVSWTAPTASDNCAVTSFTSDYEPGATFPVGTTTVTYTAKDAADNEATCSFTVTVADDEDPVITDCPSNISVAVDEGTCGAGVSWTAPTASDNCAVTSFTSDYEPGATLPVGTTTVTYTAKDAADNEATCSFTVTVADDEDPVITDCPSNISVAVDEGTCGAVVSWTAPTASDNCAVESFTSTHSPGATFPVGTTTVTYTAKDAADNEATCSFTVTVADDEDPVITDCPSNISVAVDEGTCGAVVSWTAPTASDNCAVTSFTSDYEPGATFPVGTTTVTYTAEDAADNEATCSFTVTVTDDEDPTITITAVTQGAVDLLGVDAVAMQGDVTITVEADDNCGLPAAPTVTVTPQGGSPEAATFVEEDPTGTFIYTWTVTAATANGTATINASVADTSSNANSDSAEIEVNKNQITGTVSFSTWNGTAYNVVRDVDFVATDSSEAVLDEWTETLTFVNDPDPDSPTYKTASAAYTLALVPQDTANLSAKTAWALRTRVEGLDMSADNGQAVAAIALRGGDLDESNSINILDYARLKVRWGATGETAAPVDINGDGVINILDYSIVKENWFKVGAAE